jgi:hypothetical protein
MKRPVGYTVIALLLVLWSLPQLASTLVKQPSTFAVALPHWRHVLDVVAGTAALFAGIVLWMQRRWSPEAFLGWGVLDVAISARRYFVELPADNRALRAITHPGKPSYDAVLLVPLTVDFLAWVGVVAVVYWYLRVRRPHPADPGVPAE